MLLLVLPVEGVPGAASLLILPGTDALSLTDQARVLVVLAALAVEGGVVVDQTRVYQVVPR